MKIIILSLLFAVSFAQADDVGFVAGNMMKAFNIEGRLYVTCIAGNYNMTWADCRGHVMDGGSHDYFVGPKVDGEAVSLQALWSNGKKSKMKSERYNATTGKSKGTFNLWIHTLFQKPLLNYGKNIVSYNITKNGKSMAKGSFEATVEDGGLRTCSRIGHFTSSKEQECRNPTHFCDQYFYEENDCK